MKKLIFAASILFSFTLTYAQEKGVSIKAPSKAVKGGSISAPEAKPN